MKKDSRKAIGNKSVNKIQNKDKKTEKIDAEIISLIKDLKKAEKNKKGSNSEGAEESELEKDVEVDFEEDLKRMEFHQFMQSSAMEGKAPVLERMALSAPRPIFVGGIPQSREADTKDEKEGDFKYVSSNTEKNESKYTETSTIIYHEPERVDLNQIGRTRDNVTQINQQTFFTQSPEARATSQDAERLWRVDRFEIEKAGRKNPLERDEMRYEKYKPRTKL